MLTIYGRANSSNVQKVLWALDECGVAYERIEAGRQFGFPDDYTALNPNKLVPVLLDGDMVLWESNAIVRYVARQYGLGHLAPIDLKQFADADRWMDWGSLSFYGALGPAFVHLFRLPAADKKQSVIDDSYEKTLGQAKILDAHFATRRYATGETFNMADIVIGLCVQRWFNMPFAQYNPPELQHLRRYYKLMQARPAFVKWVDPALT